MKTLTKWQLFGALAVGGPLKTDKADFVTVNEVAREDGSNRSWNVTGYVMRDGSSASQTVCVRTID